MQDKLRKVLLTMTPFLVASIAKPDFEWLPQNAQSLGYLLRLKDTEFPYRLAALSVRDELFSGVIFIFVSAICYFIYKDVTTGNTRKWYTLTVGALLVMALTLFFLGSGFFII